jgi:hypothetical protein
MQSPAACAGARKAQGMSIECFTDDETKREGSPWAALRLLIDDIVEDLSKAEPASIRACRREVARDQQEFRRPSPGAAQKRAKSTARWATPDWPRSH